MYVAYFDEKYFFFYIKKFVFFVICCKNVRNNRKA